MAVEHFDVSDHGRWIIRHRRRLPPEEALSRQNIRHPRTARRTWRHLGSLPLSRSALRLRHVHHGLFVPSLDRRQAIGSGAEIREYIAATARDERHRTPHPLPPPHRARFVVVAASAMDHRSRAHFARRSAGAGAASPATFCFPAPDITATPRATRPSLPTSTDSAGRYCTPRPGPKIWTTPVSAWSSSAAAPPPSPCPRAGRNRRPRDHAAAFAHLHCCPAGRTIPSANGCAASCPRGHAHRLSRWKKSRSPCTSINWRVAGLAWPRRHPQNACPRRPGPRLRRGDAFQPPLHPWEQRLCLAPDGDFFQALRSGAPASSPPKSNSSPQAASAPIGSGPRSRHHRHRHRPRPAAVRRHRSGRDGRLVDPGESAVVQRPDARGRSQFRVGLRLHQRIVDTQS